MAKVKWGGAISSKAIDEVDTSKQFTPYDGPTPPNGVYRFNLKVLKRAQSSQGNPQLRVGLELVPSKNSPEQKRYKDYFLMDFIPVMESTAFRVRGFLDAIGVSSSDFVNKTLEDEEKNITKIGKWTPGGTVVAASIGMGQDAKGNDRMEIKQYVPLSNDDDDDQDDDTDDADDDDEPPF